MTPDAAAIAADQDADAEEARIEASLRDVMTAADRLLALDLEGVEPAADFSPEWSEERG